jgi:hypothetical protein
MKSDGPYCFERSRTLGLECLAQDLSSGCSYRFLSGSNVTVRFRSPNVLLWFWIGYSEFEENNRDAVRTL